MTEYVEVLVWGSSSIHLASNPHLTACGRVHDYRKPQAKNTRRCAGCRRIAKIRNREDINQMTFHPPIFEPARTKPIRDGVAYLFPVFRSQLEPQPAGYNPRDVDDVPYSTGSAGWHGHTPSRHAYTAAFDFMTNRPEFGDLGHGYAAGLELRNWAIKVATDPAWHSFDVAYGGIVEVIHYGLIWTHARGLHHYTGLSAHHEHVHIGLHCPELPDPT